jgi:hypothetical protein
MESKSPEGNPVMGMFDDVLQIAKFSQKSEKGHNFSLDYSDYDNYESKSYDYFEGHKRGHKGHDKGHDDCGK